MAGRQIHTGYVVQTRVWCVAGEQASVNTFYHQCTAEVGLGVDESAFAVAIDSDIAADFKALIGAPAEYRGVQCRVINETPLHVEQDITFSAGIGTGGTTLMDRQAAGLITWRTDFAGPHQRGRSYLPFPTNVFNANDGTPNLTYQDLLTTLATDLLGFTSVVVGANSIEVHMVLAHLRPLPLAFQFIKNFDVRAKWATQKRRGSYGRANFSPI